MEKYSYWNNSLATYSTSRTVLRRGRASNRSFLFNSIVLHGEKAPLGKYGYSRDHRPDKKQITLGISELADPINVLIGITVEQGNLHDQKHFQKTYQQVIKD